MRGVDLRNLCFLREEGQVIAMAERVTYIPRISGFFRTFRGFKGGRGIEGKELYIIKRFPGNIKSGKPFIGAEIDLDERGE